VPDASQSKSYLIDDLQVTWSASSIVGKVRLLNEDSFLDEPGLFVVADGMGGHEAGDIASRITTDVCRQQAGHLPLQIQQLEELAFEANTQVRAYGQTEGNTGMGTTLVGLAMIHNGSHHALAIINVGDSRCYSFHPDVGLIQVTRDHSIVQELVDAGAITPSEAAVHPDRNLITRAIGVDESVVADLFVVPRPYPERFLLCSDGVSGQLSDEAMAQCLATHVDPANAVQALLDEVMEGVADDNATAIVVDAAWTSDPD
jgi:protein phosphatase